MILLIGKNIALETNDQIYLTDNLSTEI